MFINLLQDFDHFWSISAAYGKESLHEVFFIWPPNKLILKRRTYIEQHKTSEPDSSNKFMQQFHSDAFLFRLVAACLVMCGVCQMCKVKWYHVGLYAPNLFCLIWRHWPVRPEFTVWYKSGTEVNWKER